ncbi:MAG: hypothetical protein AAF488_01635 [Planctomycetota bacterium]
MSLRFRDQKQYLAAFRAHVWVRCPRCRQRGEVTKDKFVCGSCALVQTDHGQGWAGMAKTTVRRPCGWCGRRLQKTDRRIGPHPRKVAVHCSSCQYTNIVNAYWTPAPEDGPYDPKFGLPLWLQTRCAGEVLWAYNAEHLEFLNSYVGAELREREPNANATLASRLPSWIKRAKNRPKVLRALRRLESKLKP